MSEIYIVLEEMNSILLRFDNCKSWSKKITQLMTMTDITPKDLRYEIQTLYGGMGSLNDLVLCDSNGKMDRDSNIQFDSLRARLYELASQLR